MARYYEYGTGDYQQWTVVCTGGEASPRYVKTTYDGLGRVSSEERPAATGGIFTTCYSYFRDDAYHPAEDHAAGQLKAISPSTTTTPRLRYDYDDFGQLLFTVVDVDRGTCGTAGCC